MRQGPQRAISEGAVCLDSLRVISGFVGVHRRVVEGKTKVPDFSLIFQLLPKRKPPYSFVFSYKSFFSVCGLYRCKIFRTAPNLFFQLRSVFPPFCSRPSQRLPAPCGSWSAASTMLAAESEDQAASANKRDLARPEQIGVNLFRPGKVMHAGVSPDRPARASPALPGRYSFCTDFYIC